MSENVLLKNILDRFMALLDANEEIPNDFIESLKKLRQTGKIAKGSNLKNFVEDYTVVEKNEN